MKNSFFKNKSIKTFLDFFRRKRRLSGVNCEDKMEREVLFELVD